MKTTDGVQFTASYLLTSEQCFTIRCLLKEREPAQIGCRLISCEAFDARIYKTEPCALVNIKLVSLRLRDILCFLRALSAVGSLLVQASLGRLSHAPHTCQGCGSC